MKRTNTQTVTGHFVEILGARELECVGFQVGSKHAWSLVRDANGVIVSFGSPDAAAAMMRLWSCRKSRMVLSLEMDRENPVQVVGLKDAARTADSK